MTPDEASELPLYLQKVNLTIWKQSYCVDAYTGFEFNITDRMICAAKYGQTICHGDSGGPLVVYDAHQAKWILQGVVSWQDQCGLPYHPGVYARVSELMPWITKTIDENS